LPLPGPKQGLSRVLKRRRQEAVNPWEIVNPIIVAAIFAAALWMLARVSIDA